LRADGRRGYSGGMDLGWIFAARLTLQLDEDRWSAARASHCSLCWFHKPARPSSTWRRSTRRSSSSGPWSRPAWNATPIQRARSSTASRSCARTSSPSPTPGPGVNGPRGV